MKPGIRHSVEVEVCSEHGLWLAPDALQAILKVVTDDLERYWRLAAVQAYRDGNRGFFDF